MNIYAKLLVIQHELNAPKGNHNDFGNYNYRSAEDILAAVKPLLWEYKCVLLLSDEIVERCGEAFVCATATVIDTESMETVQAQVGAENGRAFVSVTAYAKHPGQKKGMDDSQVTGATSSYARKYAMNGLFAIDDVKDADALPPDNSPRKGTDKADKGKTEAPRRSKDLQLVFDMTQLLSTMTGEKPGQIARKLEAYVGHPINEELNSAHYTRIKQWFREQGVTDD